MQPVARQRLIVAWDAFRSVFAYVLAHRTLIEYGTCVRYALEDLPALVTAAALITWHRVTLLSVRHFSLVYANQCLSSLRSVTRRAADLTGDVELASMLARVQPVRDVVLPPRCPPRDFLAMTLEPCRNPAERAWCMLAGLAGLRYGELLGLMVDDYERTAGVLRVVRQRHVDHRKNKRPHAVTVDARELRDALEWTLDHRAEAHPRMGWHRGRTDGRLFPWAHKYAEGMLERIREHVGPRYLPAGWGWHAWRHWGASELAYEGKSLWEIQAWLGHASPAMASRYVAMVRGQTMGSVGCLMHRLRAVQRARSPRSVDTIIESAPGPRSSASRGLCQSPSVDAAIPASSTGGAIRETSSAANQPENPSEGPAT